MCKIRICAAVPLIGCFQIVCIDIFARFQSNLQLHDLLTSQHMLDILRLRLDDRRLHFFLTDVEILRVAFCCISLPVFFIGYPADIIAVFHHRIGRHCIRSFGRPFDFCVALISFFIFYIVVPLVCAGADIFCPFRPCHRNLCGQNRRLRSLQ